MAAKQTHAEGTFSGVGMSGSWSLDLPQKTSSLAYNPALKPRAKLIITTDERGQETLLLAVAQARHLIKHARELEACTSRAELIYKVQESAHYCAKLKLEQLINKREYSESELTEKLRQDGYMQVLVDELIDHARTYNLVNNKRFADSFVRSKVAQKWGLKKIEQELKRHGINPFELLDEYPDAYLSEDDALEQARTLAWRKALSGKNDFQKIVRLLVSKGYPSALAYRVAHERIDESEDHIQDNY